MLTSVIDTMRVKYEQETFKMISMFAILCPDACNMKLSLKSVY